jgi:hypothetical protein
LGIAIIVVEIVKGYKVGIETATLGCSRERVSALARDFVPLDSRGRLSLR